MKRGESIAARTLLTIARQRKGLDPDRCRLVFAHLDIALALQAGLQRVLARHQLSDRQFAALVVLFALEPELVPASVLAAHAAVSRPAITEALDHLEQRGLAKRARNQRDRRMVGVRITQRGRKTVDEALVDYLHAAGRIARFIEPAVHPPLLALYLRLQEGAAHSQD